MELKDVYSFTALFQDNANAVGMSKCVRPVLHFPSFLSRGACYDRLPIITLASKEDEDNESMLLLLMHERVENLVPNYKY
jgi:hypothetical protein